MATRVTCRQQAYRRIREKICSGEIGTGTAISENRLAKDLGMSRTPVREAIRQMEMEGLLDYEPRYGAVVRKIDGRELGEMYAVREAMESLAADMAARAIDDAAIERLRECLATMESVAQDFDRGGEQVLKGEALRRFLSADMEFHRVVLEASGNRYLSRIVVHTHLLVHVFRATFWQYDKAKLDEALAFHRRLLDALAARDPVAARSVTAEAMKVSKERALNAWKSVEAAGRSTDRDSMEW